MTAAPSPTTKWTAWYAALRPRVFTAAYVPMGMAGAIALQDGLFANAQGARNSAFFVLSLIGVMLLQTTANLVNEYMDFRKGAEDLKQAGQSMVIKNNLLTPSEVLGGAIIATVAGSLIGVFLLSQSGAWLLLIGLGGVLVAITYTAGPFPLAYNGLGEAAAGIFMGQFVVLGAYYVLDPSISATKGAILCFTAFPIMLMTAAILHANNIRDIDADRAVNKRTLAVRFGIATARQEYKVLVYGTYLSQIVLILLGWMPITTLLTLMTIPEAQNLVRVLDTETEVQKLHAAQGGTAKLHGKIGLLLVVGWVIWIGLDRLI